MTRERQPAGPVFQRAYGVLDKYKISRTFFIKTDQNNCDTTSAPVEASETNAGGYDIVVDDDAVAEAETQADFYHDDGNYDSNTNYYKKKSSADKQPVKKTESVNNTKDKVDDAKSDQSAPDVVKAD